MYQEWAGQCLTKFSYNVAWRCIKVLKMEVKYNSFIILQVQHLLYFIHSPLIQFPVSGENHIFHKAK